MFFVNPGVRVSRRNRVSHSRILSVLFRRLTGADRRCFRMGSRFYEAEFPLVRLIVYRVLLLLRSGNTTGSPARDRAPKKIGALRPFNNWVKPEDQYGILSTWEERPAFARRLPQTGRATARVSKIPRLFTSRCLDPALSGQPMNSLAFRWALGHNTRVVGDLYRFRSL